MKIDSQTQQQTQTRPQNQSKTEIPISQPWLSFGSFASFVPKPNVVKDEEDPEPIENSPEKEKEPPTAVW